MGMSTGSLPARYSPQPNNHTLDNLGRPLPIGMKTAPTINVGMWHAPSQMPHTPAINQPIPLPGYHPPVQNPIAGGPVAYPGGNNGQVPGLPGGPIMNPLQGPMPINGAMSGANNMIDPVTGLPIGSGSMFAMPGGNPGGPIGGPVGMNPIPAQR
jgi:hypothetical protein